MNKKTDNNIPDFSKVFDIDSESLPTELIEKDPDASTRNLGFLSEDKKDAEEKREDKKKQKKEEKQKKAGIFKNRLIAALFAIIFLFISATAVKIVINESKKPIIETEKPVVQTISRYTKSTGVTISSGNSFKVVFIDNDYDVHYIEYGQAVELIDENGNIFTGKITDIREANPESYYIKNYASVLIGEAPSTAVYAVFVTPDDFSAFSKEGQFCDITVFTKTVTDALTVNAASVYIDGNQPYVWLYSPIKNTLTKKAVSTGLTVDGITQIIAGLDKSDRIAGTVSCEESRLFDGIKVKVRN